MNQILCLRINQYRRSSRLNSIHNSHQSTNTQEGYLVHLHMCHKFLAMKCMCYSSKSTRSTHKFQWQTKKYNTLDRNRKLVEIVFQLNKSHNYQPLQNMIRIKKNRLINNNNTKKKKRIRFKRADYIIKILYAMICDLLVHLKFSSR